MIWWFIDLFIVFDLYLFLYSICHLINLQLHFCQCYYYQMLTRNYTCLTGYVEHDLHALLIFIHSSSRLCAFQMLTPTYPLFISMHSYACIVWSLLYCIEYISKCVYVQIYRVLFQESCSMYFIQINAQLFTYIFY